jgi:hypothetical protein
MFAAAEISRARELLDFIGTPGQSEEEPGSTFWYHGVKDKVLERWTRKRKNPERKG